MVIFGSCYICISVRKHHICVGVGARKVENLVRFLSNFDPYFPIFGEYEKGAKYILKVLEYIAKILKILKAWK